MPRKSPFIIGLLVACVLGTLLWSAIIAGAMWAVR